MYAREHCDEQQSGVSPHAIGGPRSPLRGVVAQVSGPRRLRPPPRSKYDSVKANVRLRLRLQVSTSRPALETAARHVFPEATQSNVPPVQVFPAEHVCTSAVPPVVPVGSEQRVSTVPRSFPPATFDPTHSMHAFPPGAIAPVAPRRQTAVPVHKVVPDVGSVPCAVHVPKVSVPRNGVPVTSLPAPTQTKAFGTHWATHAAPAPATPVVQTPTVQGVAGVDHCPKALQVSIASVLGPPSAETHRVKPGEQTPPQSFPGRCVDVR